MKAFLDHINSQGIEQLKSELRELYSSFEVVRNYYLIKFSDTEIDEKLLATYKDQITQAIYPNKYMQGGLDTEKVDNVIQQLNSHAIIRYYIEASLHAVEECTNIANEFGGDFGEDFYIYFEELFDDVVKVILKENIESEYQIRLQEIANSACEGYGHYDQLQDTLSKYFGE
ncbi:DUF6155 family protein [Tunicatimonas pelagia]|uniref:DUF6155 family protein n=1 Tax=Tunicatimonas pelagia TaxID=931531 RepID=UPI0026662484|nr:DUF6155 family protein [Tunicatimonas pelagia]WKN41848.1 DUF6155 family protein [Tunicatimonas pelagia]